MLRTFETDEEKYQKFKAMCAREGKKVGDKINELIENELKVHGEGNPAFSLEKWVEVPEFRCYPAMMDPMRNWNDYLSKCKPEEAEQIYHTCTGIREIARNYF